MSETISRRLSHRSTMNTLTTAYEDGLRENLQDPAEVMAYLDAALEENDQEIILMALRDIVNALSSITKL